MKKIWLFFYVGSKETVEIRLVNINECGS